MDSLQDIFHWMTNSKLKLNANKREFLIIGTKTGKLGCFFADTYTKPEFNTDRLSTEFDNNKNVRQHISQTCRCCFYHIRDLRRIRRCMSFAVAKTIATALVSSRLAYCNSVIGYIEGYIEASTCAKLFGKGSYPVSSFL